MKEASIRYNKTVSNISYLIRYGRVSKYDSNGNKIKNAQGNGLYVSTKELDIYFKKLNKKFNQIKEQIGDFNDDLAFFGLAEAERTKHVHRLHPYLGKFIPQLVEFYLKTYFNEGDWILDPFMGSGTTLVEANEQNISCTGIDISEFNCMISMAKMENYEIDILKKEINSIYRKFENYCKRNSVKINLDSFFSDNNVNKKLELQNDYLKKWYFPNVFEELIFLKQLINEYHYKNLLRIILSRTARSCRLVFHFELTRQNEPILEPYVCHKHLNKVCSPLTTCLPHFKKYCQDTLRRIKIFKKLKTNSKFEILKGDSKNIQLPRKYDGLFTSPPYVGLINYHEQHRYAYELFDLPWDEDKEIGLQKNGTSKKAREEYIQGISDVFRNLFRFLKDEAKVFIVANDKYGLYPKIAELSGFEIVNEDQRPVTQKASRERAFYNETIFHFKKKK